MKKDRQRNRGPGPGSAAHGLKHTAETMPRRVGLKAPEGWLPPSQGHVHHAAPRKDTALRRGVKEVAKECAVSHRVLNSQVGMVEDDVGARQLRGHRGMALYVQGIDAVRNLGAAATDSLLEANIFRVLGLHVGRLLRWPRSCSHSPPHM
jgi:hypothetical protein